MARNVVNPTTPAPLPPPPLGQALPPHTAGGPGPGLFSTYPPGIAPGTPAFTLPGAQNPPRPVGVPCIEITGWHRDVTTAEATTAGASI